MGEADVRDAVGRVVAALREAGRAEGTIRRQQVVLDRFAAFLVGRDLVTPSDQVCIDFVANQTGVRLGSLRERIEDRDVQAVRRPVVLIADALSGLPVEVHRSVIPGKDGCPTMFRPLRDDYLASCRRRGNAEATVAAKDKVASRFLGYLNDVGVDDLAELGVRELSGFFLRQRGLRRKTIAATRSCVADFLDFLATAGRAPQGPADRLPPHRHVRHESEPHPWTADEIRQLLAVIDRQSATGKRDYAMILATARLGLRISDLRQLELGDQGGSPSLGSRSRTDRGRRGCPAPPLDQEIAPDDLRFDGARGRSRTDDTLTRPTREPIVLHALLRNTCCGASPLSLVGEGGGHPGRCRLSPPRRP